MKLSRFLQTTHADCTEMWNIFAFFVFYSIKTWEVRVFLGCMAWPIDPAGNWYTIINDEHA